jgi:hypothetical protein
MVVDVVESVLGNVTDDQIGVLPHGTTEIGFSLSSQDLDQSRFTGTVGTENGDSGRKRDLERDVVQLLLRRSRVLERNISHLHQCLLLGLDTVEEWRVGELELVVLGNIQLEVGSGLGNVTDKGFEVTGVSLELEVVQVESIGDGSVKEIGIVRDNDGGTVGEGGEVVDQPSDVDDIQMIGRLVEQQDIGLEQDSSGKSELHLPTTGKRSDTSNLLLGVETNSLEGLDDLLGGSQESLVGKNPVLDRDLGLGTIDIVLNVESSDLGWWRETIDLVVDDGVHQSRFTRTVSSTKTVSVTSLQSHVGVVQQDLGTVGQIELFNVAKILTLFLIGKLDFLSLGLVGLLLEKFSDGG